MSVVFPIHAIEASQGSNLLWEYQTGGFVSSVALSSDGQYVAAGSNDANVYLFSQDGKLLWKYTTKDIVYSVAMSADGQYVAAGSNDGNVYLFNRDGTLLWKYENRVNVGGYGMPWRIDHVAISLDGQYVAAASYGNIYMFNKDGSFLWKYQSGRLDVVSLSSDGQYVAVSGFEDANFYLFNRNGTLLRNFITGSKGSVVALSSDGQYVVAGSVENGDVYMFNRDGSLLWKYTIGVSKYTNQGGVYGVAVSSDGRYIAVSGSGEPNFYLLSNKGNLLQKYTTGGGGIFAISGDGQYVVSNGFAGFNVSLFRNFGGVTTGIASQSKIVTSTPTVQIPTTAQYYPTIQTVTPTPTYYSPIIKNAQDSISQAQNAIDTYSQYDQSAAKQELARAQNYFSNKDYSNAINSAQNAYVLANESEQKKVLNIVLAAFVGILIITTIILYDRKRCTANLSLSVTAPDIYEGDNAQVILNTGVTGKLKDLNCSLRLNTGETKEITQTGKQVADFGVLPVGIYEFTAQCTVKKIRYGEVTQSTSATFHVKERVPEISVTPQPMECFEGDAEKVKIRITNISPFAAVFDNFTLNSQESKEIEFDADTSVTGTKTKTEKIPYHNEQGGAFETEVILNYRVKLVEPAIHSETSSVECNETDRASAQVIIKNISEHDSIFKDFTLKPNESRAIDIPLDTKKAGKQSLNYSLEFQDKLGRVYKNEVPITYDVKPLEPELKTDVSVPECTEGDDCFADVTLINTSPFDAISADFTLRPKEKHVIRIPLDTANPGKQSLTHPLEYKNKLGVTFRKEIEISYTVKSIDPILEYETKIPECFEHEPAIATITLTNISQFNAIFNDFIIAPSQTRTIDISLDTTKPGQHAITHMLEYKNTVGRKISQSINIQYPVNPSRLEKVSREIETMKNSYPTLLQQPELNTILTSLEKNLKSHTQFEVIESELISLNEKLQHAINQEKIFDQLNARKERAKQLIEEAEKLGTVPESVYQKLQTEDIVSIESAIKDIEEFNKTATPNLTVTFDHTHLVADKWHKVNIPITNKGNAHATDVIFTFSEEFETKGIKPIAVKAGKTTNVDIGILPKKEGTILLEIIMNYHDGRNKEFHNTYEFWIDVVEKGTITSPPSQTPSSPVSQFTPKPLTPKQLPPDLADRYTESEFIGKGGFARVFKAKRKDGKLVAVKIPISMDAMTGKSFIAEMQNWTKLSHPNIVRLYDFNIMPMPFFEEELCDNALADQNKPIESEEAAWILFNICEGLKFAHAQKIIHRDLKPQNILLKSGVPKISDWGLSRIISETTTTSAMSFTPYYAAPEQINNRAKDERTDIWQLGVILYELVTGVLPFKGDSMVEIGMNIATKDPKRPGELKPDAKVIDAVVMKCLQKDPAKRYQSVLELQKDLATYLRKNYTDLLKTSVSVQDYNRSAYYCGDLVMINMLTGDLATAYKYLLDLVHYSKGDVKAEARELSEQIKMRMEMGVTEIPDELITKAEIIVHKVSAGFRKR